MSNGDNVLFWQAVSNVNTIIGPALIGKVCIPYYMILLISYTHTHTHTTKKKKRIAFLTNGVFCCRIPLSKLTLITSWFNSLMEPPTTGAGANKRYYSITCVVTMLLDLIASDTVLFALTSFDVVKTMTAWSKCYSCCFTCCVQSRSHGEEDSPLPGLLNNCIGI